MDEIVAAFKQGNNTLIRQLLRVHVSELDATKLIQNAVRHGNVNALVYVLDFVNWTEYHMIIAIRALAMESKLDTLERMCAIYTKEHGPLIHRIYDLVGNVTDVNALECLFRNRWIPSASDIQWAINDGNAMFVKWCFERGFTYVNVMWIETKTCTREILELLHNYKVQGDYQEDCMRGRCSVCKKCIVGEMWEMDRNEFENTIQWLPREMVEDSLEFV